MDQGLGSQRRLNFLFRVDGCQGLIVAKVVGCVPIKTLIDTSYMTSRESFVVTGCLVNGTMYSLSPRSFVNPTRLPRKQSSIK